MSSGANALVSWSQEEARDEEVVCSNRRIWNIRWGHFSQRSTIITFNTKALPVGNFPVGNFPVGNFPVGKYYTWVVIYD